MAGMTDLRLDPTRTAILIMDLQTEILGMVDDVDRYLERVVGVTISAAVGDHHDAEVAVGSVADR